MFRPLLSRSNLCKGKYDTHCLRLREARCRIPVEVRETRGSDKVFRTVAEYFSSFDRSEHFARGIHRLRCPPLFETAGFRARKQNCVLAMDLSFI